MKMESLDQALLHASTFWDLINSTAQKVKFSIKDFFSKCDQIRSFLRISSHLLKKSLMQSFIFYVVSYLQRTSWIFHFPLRINYEYIIV